MTEERLALSTFYKGWDIYQQRLVTAITPLTADQLALSASPQHWSIGMLATHIVSARVGWFHMWMGVGSPDLRPLQAWDDEEQLHPPAEIVAGLEATWQMIQEALASWTPAELGAIFSDPYVDKDHQGTRRSKSRQWIIWHVLEHDLHHGGEISLTLGMHGLTSLNL